jgi:hypothetical protein
MPLDLPHLDERTRRYMLAELDADVAADVLYCSPQLSEAGLCTYQRLLRAAILSGTEETFAEGLGSLGAVRPPSRWQHPKDVGPAEALAEATFRLAEREFHRFYIRGLCCHALEQGINVLVIYRARPADPGRAPADSMIGLRIDVGSLLEDLRGAFRTLPPHGLPQCRDPGLSVRFPDDAPGRGDDLPLAGSRRAMRGT